jgi:hypothetical protein
MAEIKVRAVSPTLQSFNLPVIDRYYPEYPKEIRKRLG